MATSLLWSNTKKISLKDCIKISLDNHPNLMVSEESKKGIINDYLFVKAKSSILVNGEIKTVEYLKQNSSTNSAFNIPGSDTDIGLFAGLNAKYTIYDGRQIKLEKAAAVSVDIAKLDSQRVRNETVFNVKRAYYEYLFARENKNFQYKLTEKLKDKLNQVRVLYKTGQRPILDVTKAEVSYSESQLDYEKSKNNESQKKTQLFSAMGISETDVEISDVSLDSLPEMKYSSKDLSKFAETYNPVVMILALNKRANKIKVEAERARYYPTLDILFQLGFENTGLKGFDQFDQNFSSANWKPAFHASIQAAFPIYTGGAIAAKIESAIAEYNKSVYKEREILIDINRSILNNYRNLAELSKQIKLSEAVVENAEKHLLLATRTYQTGAGQLFELYDAETTLIKAQLSQLSTKYNYLLTVSMIAQIVGVEEDSICKK